MKDAEATYKTLAADSVALEIRTLLNGEYDGRFAVVTIRSGTGEVDVADFAQMLLRMCLRWAKRHGHPTRMMDTSYAEGVDIESVTFEIDMPYAYERSSVEAGAHYPARASPFDAAGKHRTSFATVEVIPLIKTTDHIDVPESDVKIDVFRSSDSRGQSVNTMNSAMHLTHLSTDITIPMQGEKSRIQNRATTIRVLQS